MAPFYALSDIGNAVVLSASSEKSLVFRQHVNNS